jgi:hypothetical protein
VQDCKIVIPIVRGWVVVVVVVRDYAVSQPQTFVRVSVVAGAE